jgi:hypothetical protein
MYFRKFSIQYCVREKLLPTIEPQSSAPIYFNFGTLVMDIIPEFLSAFIHFNWLIFNSTIMAAMQICGVSEVLVLRFEVFKTTLFKTSIFKIFY